jgi:hypothetical protein
MTKRNLTKELAQRVKATKCPIMQELQEQYDQTQFYKSLNRFSGEFEKQYAQKTLIPAI